MNEQQKILSGRILQKFEAIETAPLRPVQAVVMEAVCPESNVGALYDKLHESRQGKGFAIVCTGFRHGTRIHCGFHFHGGGEDEILRFCEAGKLAGNCLGPWAERFVSHESMECDPLMNWVRVLSELSRRGGPVFPIHAEGRYWDKDRDSEVDLQKAETWLKPPAGDDAPYGLHVVLDNVVQMSLFAIDVLVGEYSPVAGASETVLAPKPELSEADARREIEEQLDGNSLMLFRSLNRRFGRWVWFGALRDDNERWRGVQDGTITRAIKRLRDKLPGDPYVSIEVDSAPGGKRAKMDK